MRLDAKTIIITGAASGIGQASAAKAMAEGARVIGVDLDAKGMPGGVEPVLGDVCDDDTIARAIKAAGPIDGLATIAGISNSGVAIDAIDPDDWNRVFAVNVTATWRWMIGVLPAMRAQGGGSIVAIASQLAFGGGRNNAAYIASKGAIVSLVKTAAFELAPDTIRVNAVAPGAIDTPMFNRSMARARDPAADLVARGAAQFQPEGDVPGDRQVRVQRVVLEHHGDVAVLRLDPGDVAAADPDAAAGDVLQPGDHAQQRGLAAARRPDHHGEPAVGHRQVDAVDHLVGVERLADVGKLDLRHACASVGRIRVP